MSVPPPGGNGTMMRTGFTGYVWAWAAAAAPKVKATMPIALITDSSSELMNGRCGICVLQVRGDGRQTPRQRLAGENRHQRFAGPVRNLGGLRRGQPLERYRSAVPRQPVK